MSLDKHTGRIISRRQQDRSKLGKATNRMLEFRKREKGSKENPSGLDMKHRPAYVNPTFADLSWG